MNPLRYFLALFCSPTLEERAASDLKEAQIHLLEKYKEQEAVNAGIAALEARIKRLTKSEVRASRPSPATIRRVQEAVTAKVAK